MFDEKKIGLVVTDINCLYGMFSSIFMVELIPGMMVGD